MSNPHRRFKNALYDQFTRVGKALANPHRIELLELLSQGPRTVEVLARATAMTLPNTSQHLHVLRDAGLVESEKEGLYVTYRLSGDKVAGLILSLRQVSEAHLAEVERVTRAFFTERGAMEPIGREELLQRAGNGEVVVLDVRPPEEFAAGHLPRAISIPVEKLVERLAELPRDKLIVAYCRGPFCVFAVDAVKMLHSHGFDARRLEEGVLEWRALGLPVETAVERSLS